VKRCAFKSNIGMTRYRTCIDVRAQPITNLTNVYVSRTAGQEPPDQAALQPLAGGLFAFDASVPGFTL
jgi:hypothetical protein